MVYPNRVYIEHCPARRQRGFLLPNVGPSYGRTLTQVSLCGVLQWGMVVFMLTA